LWKIANKVNGIAKANEKPNIPITGLIISPWAEAIKIEPATGPVQEKETKTKVNAMKKTPMIPPLSDCASILLTKLEGKTISNQPRNEIPKKTKMTKITY